MSIVEKAKRGRRPGEGGRQVGAEGKFTKVQRERVERELATGNLMPLDYLLQVMRSPLAKQSRRDWAAQTAAPYLHPKLQAIAMGELNPPKPSEGRKPMDTMQFARALALVLRQAAASAQDVTINGE